jgi:hypothetical protein
MLRIWNVLVGAALCLCFANVTPAQADPDDSAEAALKNTLAELARARKEIKSLRSVVNKQEAQLLALQAERDRVRKDAEIAENQVKALQERVLQLENTLQKLQRQLTALHGGQPKGPAAGTRNPPPGNLKGAITKIDPVNSKLVTINLGTDDGLQVNHTLEVFRLKPQPVYLGTIRILDATGRSAVAQLLLAPQAGRELKVGDQVASQISP